MDCPNCGTWNPEDKEVCWRCQTELPRRPEPKPKRRTYGGLPMWMWMAFLLFFIATSFGQCLFTGPPGA